MTNQLTTPDYWAEGYRNIHLERQAESHSVNQFLKNNLQPGAGKTCLEIGSYPGPFLATIGDAGYTVSGVDFNDDNATGLPHWLQSQGIKTGDFWVADFFKFNPGKQYDLVVSFGFIEHFTNFDEVIKKHTALVAPGGQLIITTPNFKGWMQQLPHRLVDAENLSKHHLPSMNPAKWKDVVEAENFSVQHTGPFGGYHFWVDKSQPRNGVEQKLLRATERSIGAMRKFFHALKMESAAFSSFFGLVATKSEAA